ncbi:MAG: FAD-dependent oxidoreductase [Pseudomonadota bacterium]
MDRKIGHNAGSGERQADIAIVGGGLVGTALAWGCVEAGARIALFDAGDDRFHASAGNFGLVWVQGKGRDVPAYAGLSRRSAAVWDSFADTLADRTGIDLSYRRTGGLKIAVSDDELEGFAEELRRGHNRRDPASDNTRLIDRKELADLVPAIGPDVRGATWCPDDGHADPLATLRALHAALDRAANVTLIRETVADVSAQSGGGFELRTSAGAYRAGRIVLAAGLGNVALAPALGLQAPVRPERGQIVVTERCDPFLDRACHTVRQTADGTVLLGDSKEEVGFDTGVTRTVATSILARAARTFPLLAEKRVVRIWGALRVLTPDGLPVYESSERCPGASVVTCHSGVTLAAAHAGEVARAVLEDRLSSTYPAFSAARFAEAAE